MRAMVRTLLLVVRHALGAGLILVVLALAARSLALVMPAARVDAIALLVRVRALVDPLLTPALAWLGLQGPSRRQWYVPLLVALFAWMVRELCVGTLDRWIRRFSGPARGTVPAPAPGPAPGPAPQPAPAPVAAPAASPAPLEATAHVADAAAALAAGTARRPAAPPPAAAAPQPWAAPAAPASAFEPTLVPDLQSTELQREPPPAARPAPAAVAAAPPANEDASEDPTLDGSARPSPRVARRPPASVGRYEILEELGRGAMGVVYRANDPQIGRAVAIKTILSANLADESVEQYKRRFAIEARAAGQLQHPGIVAVHDITEDSAGQPSLIMEFVDGDTVENLVAGDRAPGLDQLLELVAQVADALDYAHHHGVVHRDIKPANILVTRSGQVKLTDFGVAKLDGIQLTSTGMVIGTPAFMSPEQFNGAAIDARTDIFSLGSVLYWVLTGQKPFAGDTITAIGYKVMFTDPPPILEVRPGLPRALGRILDRCLAKDRAQRFATARELATELRAIRARPGVDVDATRPDVVSDPTVVDGPGPEEVS